MGEAEVELFHRWSERLGAASDPLDVWYEEVWAPDIDYRAIEGAPDDVGPILGRDAMRAYLGEWYEMFPDLVAAPEAVIDAGPETVIVMWNVSGTAKLSGAMTELNYAQVCRIRDGQMVWGREYMTKEEALAAVQSEGLAT
jgi:ketosteroid isomerase-like protein